MAIRQFILNSFLYNKVERYFCKIKLSQITVLDYSTYSVCLHIFEISLLFAQGSEDMYFANLRIKMK